MVAFFGLYALLDGAWAIASALWVTRTWFTAWPVPLEGAASAAVGAFALALWAAALSFRKAIRPEWARNPCHARSH